MILYEENPQNQSNHHIEVHLQGPSLHIQANLANPSQTQKSISEVKSKMSLPLGKPMPILLPPSSLPRFQLTGASAGASASAGSASNGNNANTTSFQIIHSNLYGGVSNSTGSPYIIVQPVNEALSEALSENAVMPNIQPMFSLGLPQGYSNLEAYPPSYSNYMPTSLPPEYVNYGGQASGAGGASSGLNEQYIIWGLIGLAVIVVIVLIVVAVKK